MTDNLKKQRYELLKCELDEIYDRIAEGVRVRSRCQQYEEGEKSNKFFLNLEKVRGSQGKVRKLIISNHEIADPQLIEQEIVFFYKSLFKNNIKKTLSEQINFLDSLQISKLSDNDCLLCEGELTESELYDALKNMPNNKSPGNDGLTKEFFLSFWDDIKNIYISSIRTAGIKKEFSVSQRQAIIKLIEKKGKDKRFIKNWRPILLLNVDYKIASKALAERLKKILPVLISHEQTAYVNGRFICETGRLISDIIEVSGVFNIKGFLVTMDIEKAFDSLNHSFLLAVLKKFGFGTSFINWIETILNKPESCVSNSGKTTQYFQLNNEKIQGLDILNYRFLYSAYADDSTFFLRNIDSVIFKEFSSFPDLSPNMSKCEIAGIGSLKGVEIAVCGMKNIDLTKDAVKIIGISFSYNKAIQNELNFRTTISKIQPVLKL